VTFCLLTLLSLLLVYQHILKEVNKQIDAGLKGEVNSLSLAAANTGLAQITAIIQARSSRESLTNSNRGDPGPRFYLLTDAQGRYLAGSMPHWQDALAQQGDTLLATLDIDTPPSLLHLVEARTHIRLRSYQATLPSGAHLLVGQALNELAELHHELLVLVLIIILLMIGAGIIGGWWIGRTVVTSLDQVLKAADRIMAGDLSQRITPSRQTDEFALLAERLNLMLSRIESLMTDLHEVAENVAHDLRTPLTRLRAHAEIALTQTRETEAQAALHTVIQESEALVRVLEAIMGIAQVEAGKRQEWQPINLAVVAADVTDFYEPLAEEKNLTLTCHLDRDATLKGNAQLLAQAIGNLMDNAIKYTPEGGSIELDLEADQRQLTLTLSDTGPGIPPALRDRALQRFVRLDNSRSKPGNGLGLALVAAIVRQHNGILRLDTAHPGHEPAGLKVSITLPLAPFPSTQD
jgi:signal transduction histidine kinase